jgi:hypothetical protein
MENKLKKKKESWRFDYKEILAHEVPVHLGQVHFLLKCGS